MKFILRMAFRETRASWRRLVFYFLCVAIGTGSIVLLRSAIRNFYDGMASDARSIVAGDILIDSSRAWPPEAGRSAKEYQVSFKFFQRVEGSFKVPSGAVVKSLQVRVFETGGTTPKLTQTVTVS